MFHAQESELVLHHFKIFKEFVEDYQFCNEDMVMKFFVKSLKDSAKDLYECLAAQSVSSWDCFRRFFLERFKYDIVSYEQPPSLQIFPTCEDTMYAQEQPVSSLECASQSMCIPIVPAYTSQSMSKFIIPK